MPVMPPVNGYLEGIEQILKMHAFPEAAPGWARPGRWSKPLCASKVRTVPAATDWFTFLTYDVIQGFGVVVDQYVATVEGDMVTSGVEFRFYQKQGPIPYVTLAPTVDRCKSSPTSYPARRQPLHFVADQHNPLILQVRNTSVATQRVIAGLFGWHYRIEDHTGTGQRSALQDV